MRGMPYGFMAIQDMSGVMCIQGPVTVASSQKVGRVIDLSWAPLPQPVGGGAVVALALEDGSLAFADTSQAVEHSSRKQRMQAFKHLLGGSWPYPQVCWPCPPALPFFMLMGSDAACNMARPNASC